MASASCRPTRHSAACSATDAEQIIGRTIGDLVHIDDRELLSDAIRRGTGPDLGIEVRYVTHSGAIAWASVRLTQLSASDGRPGLLLALAEDITREKRVEAELRQAQKMEAIGQLTGGIAHDFNNLLGVIIGNVEFLIDAVHDEEQAGLAKEILNSALSGADLTRRLLAFARRQTLQPRRIDLNAYLPNHIAILRRLLGEIDHDHHDAGGRSVADPGGSLAGGRRPAQSGHQRARRDAAWRNASRSRRRTPTWSRASWTAR